MGEPDTGRALVARMRTAYAASAQAWATGAAAVYRHLATALVASATEPLAGRRVLDLGAGTGVASEVLARVGAEPVGVDLAVEMLAHHEAQRPPGVAGDASAVPFRDQAFDAVVAAFSLNHVPDPRRALAECRRVTRSGGLVLASTFPSGDEHPAKAVVEAVLEQHGYRRPGWYEAFKTDIAHLTGDPGAFARAAVDAGLTDVRVDRMAVAAGLDDPRRAVQWRLNMPHSIGFVADLDRADRDLLSARAVAALPAELSPLVSMLTLRARVDRSP